MKNSWIFSLLSESWIASIASSWSSVFNCNLYPTFLRRDINSLADISTAFSLNWRYDSYNPFAFSSEYFNTSSISNLLIKSLSVSVSEKIDILGIKVNVL